MAENTYSRWAFLYNDWPVRDEPTPRQNVDSLIAKLTYWLGATGCDHVSGLRFITRSHDSLDEVETMGDCLAHLQEMRAELATLRAENEALRRRLANAEDERDEALQAPWPQWADAIRKCLMGYGVDPGDEWDLPEQFEDWLNGVVENETARATAAESTVSSLRDELEAITVDEIEAIVINSEPAGLSENDDKVWTRRIAKRLRLRIDAALENHRSAK